MAVAKTKIVDPWKMKRWYPVYCPKYMKGAFIGETPASESKMVLGREITISLAAIFNDIKKQNINITFKITKMEGSNALTEVKRFEISPSYVRRQVRKERDRVDDSFVLETSDKKSVSIKPFIVTRNKINNSKKTLLRKMAKQELKDYISKITYSELVQDLISSKLQKTLGSALRKVCPLRGADIRVMEILENEIPSSDITIAENKRESVAEETPKEKPQKAKEKKEKAESGEEAKEAKPKKKAKKSEETKTEE